MKSHKNDEDRYKRVILHLDLDCFYAQVEHNRLKMPLTVPLAVQQWNGLIAGIYIQWPDSQYFTYTENILYFIS